ncbi:MAG: TIGR04211 family SH3 domain-containing protein [Desulfobacula sp.]|nr:TIGR04211 family SH3 domain-containing protein [Desulfobacula sp.]
MMRRLFFYFIILIITLSLFPQSAFAKTGWVSDILILTFRQGPGNSYAVIKTLISNTPVVILDEQDGFYQVEIQSNENNRGKDTQKNQEDKPAKEIGWVDKKFIIFDPPKAILLARTKKEKATLENQLEKLSSEIQMQKKMISLKEREYETLLTPLKESLKNTMGENQILKLDLVKVKEKYSTLIQQSKNIQTIVKENKTLQKENTELTTELASLKIKTRNLFKTAMIKWFLAGVGVLFIGWLIGQSVSGKKRRYGSILG